MAPGGAARLLLLAALTPPATTDPPPPKDFIHYPQHAIGDSSHPNGHCIDPPIQLKMKGCPADDWPNKCFEVASKDCLADDDCQAFALLQQHGGNYQTYSAGMANAVPITEWDLYAKKKPCCTCSGGGKAVSATAQPSDLQLGHQSMQCEEQGTAQHGDKESAPIFCDPTISCSVEREIQNAWGDTLLLVAGPLLAVCVSHPGATLAPHPATRCLHLSPLSRLSCGATGISSAGW